MNTYAGKFLSKVRRNSPFRKNSRRFLQRTNLFLKNFFVLRDWKLTKFWSLFMSLLYGAIRFFFAGIDMKICLSLDVVDSNSSKGISCQDLIAVLIYLGKIVRSTSCLCLASHIVLWRFFSSILVSCMFFEPFEQD